MKKIIIVLTSIAIGYSVQAQQKQETIILQDSKPSANTTVEIKEGNIYIDGKKVASIDDKEKSLKIIKKNGGKEIGQVDESQIEEFKFPEGIMDMPAPTNKAMLGVATKNSREENGALVETVNPKSPAEKIGLQQGDIITKVNDKKISNPKELVEAIGGYSPGEKIQLTYMRNSKSISKEVELSERGADSYSYRKTLPFSNDEEGGMQLDMSEMFKPFMRQFNMETPMTGNATPKIGLQVEDRADADGVLVNDVKDKSAADEAGILKNDVLVKVGDKEINSVDELMQQLQANATKKTIEMQVKRNGALKNVVLTLPKNLKKKELLECY